MPPNLDEGITPEEREKLLERSEVFLPKNSSPDEKLPAELEGEESDSGAEPKEEKASESEQASEAPRSRVGLRQRNRVCRLGPHPLVRVNPLVATPRTGSRPPMVLAYLPALSLLVV